MIDDFLQQVSIIETRRKDLVEVEKCYRQWDFQKHPSATKLADAVIAKVTIAAGLSLATLDLKHFQKMEGLPVFVPFKI